MEIEEYIIENIKLGSGSFSEVYLGKHKITNNKVAIKIIYLDKKNNIIKKEKIMNKMEQEITIMKQLNHHNIVKYYDNVKSNNVWYIIMEYCNAGTLDNVIKYNDSESKKSKSFNREANTYYYMNQLKNALDYVIRMGYIHRDIKPMNILLTNDGNDNIINYNYDGNIILKLADFGLAKEYNDNECIMMNTICGSPLYMAPELLINNSYTSRADLWSYGVILYQLLFGTLPMNAKTVLQLQKNMINDDINFHLNKNFTLECFDLLIKLLTKNHVDRINWENFINHKWFIYWSSAICGDIAPEHCTGARSSNNLSQNDRLSWRLPWNANHSSNSIKNLNNQTENITEDNKFTSFLTNVNKMGSSNLTRMSAPKSIPQNIKKINYIEYSLTYPPNKCENKHENNNLISNINHGNEILDINNSLILSHSNQINESLNDKTIDSCYETNNILYKRSEPIIIKKK